MDLSTFLPILGYGSGWAIVGLFVLMLFKGKVVTEREYLGAKEESTVNREALHKALDQNSQLLQVVPLVESTFTTIRKAGEK